MATIRENYNSVNEFLKANNAPSELIDFVDSRIAQEDKQAASAKAKRLEKTGGVKKDPAQSEFYTTLRNDLMGVMTTEFQTGDALVAACGAVSSKGTPVLAAQVATALKPAVADGSVIVSEIKCSVVGKDGLSRETLRKGYKLA